jgi:hAT family C-terminal dimerisation region
MVTSSAASERNISTIGFIHSKQRNLLAPKTVEKLVYIKSNMPMFCDCPVADVFEYDSSADGEENESGVDEEEAKVLNILKLN